jgi:hypothetical protein
MKSSERELLRQFFGGYFHQDFDLEAREPAHIIDSYRRHSSDEQRVLLASLIRAFVEGCSESELSQQLRQDLWCDYVPEAGETRSWLLAVADALSVPASAQPEDG